MGCSCGGAQRGGPRPAAHSAQTQTRPALPPAPRPLLKSHVGAVAIVRQALALGRRLEGAGAVGRHRGRQQALRLGVAAQRGLLAAPRVLAGRAQLAAPGAGAGAPAAGLQVIGKHPHGLVGDARLLCGGVNLLPMGGGRQGEALPSAEAGARGAPRPGERPRSGRSEHAHEHAAPTAAASFPSPPSVAGTGPGACRLKPPTHPGPVIPPQARSHSQPPAPTSSRTSAYLATGLHLLPSSPVTTAPVAYMTSPGRTRRYVVPQSGRYA